MCVRNVEGVATHNGPELCDGIPAVAGLAKATPRSKPPNGTESIGFWWSANPRPAEQACQLAYLRVFHCGLVENRVAVDQGDRTRFYMGDSRGRWEGL
jgi:hypothetical protein